MDMIITWVVSGFRYLMFMLDTIVFGFIGLLYQLFMDISNVRLFNSPIEGTDQNIIQILAGRVYIFIGVFMLFKLAFSFLTMMVNPDSINDKEKGVGKITTRVFIMLCLIIAVPVIFNIGYAAQKPIRDAIPQIFTNVDYTNVSDKAGDITAISTFNGFIGITEGLENSTDSKAQTCINQYNEIQNGLSENKLYKISSYNKNDCLNAQVDKVYIYDYMFLISTAAGVFVAIMLINFCVDIGTRTVKLAFLELVSPIPIMSYIDPKSSKDGSFSKWVKLCISTYLDLFMRVLIISFVLFMITTLVQDESLKGLTPLVKVAIILGLLTFAKQAPDLLKDIFGIKGDVNSFSLNPLKKAKELPFLGKAAALAGGAAAMGGKFGGKLAGGTISKIRGGTFRGGFSSGTKEQFKDMAKARLDRANAKREVKDRDSDLEKGENYYNANAAGNNPFKGGNANKFKESMDAVSNAKGKMYSAQNMKVSAEQNYQSQVQRRAQLQTQIAQQQRNLNSIPHGNKEEKDEANAILNNLRSQMNSVNREVEQSYEKFVEANKMAGTAEGVYNNLKDAHEKLRASDTKNASIQDKMDLYETVNVKSQKVNDFV